MALDARLLSFVQAVGADIKAIRLSIRLRQGKSLWNKTLRVWEPAKPSGENWGWLWDAMNDATADAPNDTNGGLYRSDGDRFERRRSA